MVGGHMFTLCVVFTISLMIIFSTSVSSADAIIQEEWGFDKDPYLMETEGIVVYRNTLWAGDGVYNCYTDHAVTVINPIDDQNIIPIAVCELHDDGYGYSFMVDTESGTSVDPTRQISIKFTAGPTVTAPVNQIVQLHINLGAGNIAEIRLDGGFTDPESSESATATFTSVASPNYWSPSWYDGNWATCPTTFSPTGDKDGDGICDIWEKQDFLNNRGLVIYYPGINGTDPPFIYSGTEGFNPSLPDWETKDIYVELDYMDQQEPYDTALTNVINAFKNAPVDCDPGTVQNCKGINLHIQKDDSLAEQPGLRWIGYNWPGYEGFFQKKAYWFGDSEDRDRSDWQTLGWKQKKQVFHYGLFIDSFLNDPSTGIAEMPGNDFAIALGNAGSGNRGSVDQQEGTLMHELGHNLNLNHGGDNNQNCKLNYLSVMSYSRQMSDIVHNRALDYSRYVVGTQVSPFIMDDRSLNPNNGLGFYGPDSVNGPVGVNQTVWGVNGVPTLGNTGDKPLVGLPTGNHDILKINGVCPFTQQTAVLTSQNDWENILYDARGTAGFGNGRVTGTDNSTASALKFPEDAEGYVDPLLPTGMGINNASKYGTTYSDWTIATNEMTNATIIGARLVPLTVLDNSIQNLHPSKFIDPSKAPQIKAAYHAAIESAKDNIKNGKMISSMGKLDDVRNTFDNVDIKDEDHKKILTGVKSIYKSLTDSKYSEANDQLSSLSSDATKMSKHGGYKNYLLNSLVDAKSFIDANDDQKAKNILNSLNSTYTKTPYVKADNLSFQNLETDLIVDENVKTELQSLLDGAILSHYSAAYYYEAECPNCLVTPTTEICGELTISGPSGDVDGVSYCISDLSVNHASYISSGNEVTLDIAKAKPGSWIKLDANEMTNVAYSTDDTLTVMVDGKPAVSKMSENHGVKWITIYPDANSKQIIIAGPQVVPEFGTIAILVLTVAIVSIIAISTRTRLGMTPKYN